MLQAKRLALRHGVLPEHAVEEALRQRGVVVRRSTPVRVGLQDRVGDALPQLAQAGHDSVFRILDDAACAHV